MFLRQIQKMGLRLNLANFTKFGFGEGLRLAACTAELAHHLLELGGIHPESLGNRIQHSRIVLKGTHCLLHHLRAHSRYVGHTLRCLGLGRLLLLLSLLLLLLSVQCEVLVLIFLENRVRSLHQVVLHAGQHRCELLSHRGVHEGLRQVNNFLWDSGSQQQLSALISKVVAVVGQYVVGGLGEARLKLQHKLHEHVLIDFGHSQVNRLCWLTCQTLTFAFSLPKGV